MRVLIISPGLPSEKYPLEGVFAYDQAKALSEHGADVVFFSIDMRSIRRIRPYGYSSFVRDKVECHIFSLPIGPIGPKGLDFIGRKLGIVLYKKVFLKKSPPDVIHTHFAGPIGAYLSQKFAIPLIITEHSSYMNRSDLPQSTINRAKKDYLKAKAVVTVSSILAKSIKEKTGIDCRVIHNIIDTSIFSRYSKQSHQGFVFVTTALLSERKRIHQLLPALKQCPDYTKLIIIGDGPESPRLEKSIVELELSDRVTMTGLLSREETAKVYAKCDCFVLPSALETFGVVYVEAMAAGLPVIATRCGGPEDFVNNQNGLLIDVDNQRQLEVSMNKMIVTKQNYTPSLIKEYVQKRFSPEVISKQIIGLYLDIVNN